MIFLVTDIIDPWLSYIWGQFVQINGLETASRLVTYDEALMKGERVVIEYGNSRRLSGSLYIPRLNTYTTDDYYWIDDDTPVYRETIDSEADIDLFFNAFVHLSRLEEWACELRGKPIRSYAARHPRKDPRIWNLPIVNRLFDMLEQKIAESFPDVRFRSHGNRQWEFSHDVDYLRKTPQLRIKQSLFHFWNTVIALLHGEPRRSVRKISQAMEFLLTSREYWLFDSWRELERGLGLRSAYYIYAKPSIRVGSGLTQWLIDPSYDVEHHGQLRSTLRILADDGHAIGMHGSLFSAVRKDLFLAEKAVLERSLGMPITKARQHWLNFTEADTAHILEAADITEDSTLGFNDIPGFRAGIASRYQPYDHGQQRACSFFEVPLVIMDSHLYDYAGDRGDAALERIIAGLLKVRNCCVSFDWHQRVISDDYGWHSSYVRLASRLPKGTA